MLHIIFQSFFLVALSEMGDKTQLLALLLTTKFKKPLPILAGIFVATILNHSIASFFGIWFGENLIPQHFLNYILGAIFIVFALWMLVPDKEDEWNGKREYGAFLTTTVAFFLAEMGDKTQFTTMALAASFKNVFMVTIGTTLGMMLADGIAVLFGEAFLKFIPMKWVRILASIFFLLFGISVFFAKI